MASDDTRPKVRMLFTIGVVAVFLLLGVKFMLDSYYLDMTETYEHTLIPKTTLRDETKQKQLAAIEKPKAGYTAINVAMQTLASKGRDNASDVIKPEVSDDVDPLKGWAQLKHDVELPPQQKPGAAEEADAGAVPAAATGDAGAHAAPARDGGAPRPAPHAAPKDGGK